MDHNKILEMATAIAKQAIIDYVMTNDKGELKTPNPFSRGFGNSASQKRVIAGAERILTQYLCQTADNTEEKAA